jgi:hypothetical protein
VATLPTLTLPATPLRLPGPRERRQLRRGLAVAFVLSIAVHIAWSLWPVSPAETPDSSVLSATLTEMPAPPIPASKPAARKAARRLAPQATASAPVVDALPDSAPPQSTTQEGRHESRDGATAETPAVSEPPLATPMAPTMPPRLDLQYKVYIGNEDFWIGSATYRFEHEGNQYSIATIAQARGLAALIVRGRGKVESHGIITPTGLQPLEFAIERGSADRREVAHFDWENGVVTLHEDKTAGLDAPAYDPLTLMWQPYFSPPTRDQETFSVATTRRVARYTVIREGRERVEWSGGEVEAEKWHRVSDDGRTDAYVWLAPSMRYVPVRAQITQTLRGTLLIVLDGIHVDGEPAFGGDGANAGSRSANATTKVENRFEFGADAHGQ